MKLISIREDQGVIFSDFELDSGNFVGLVICKSNGRYVFQWINQNEERSLPVESKTPWLNNSKKKMNELIKRATEIGIQAEKEALKQAIESVLLRIVNDPKLEGVLYREREEEKEEDGKIDLVELAEEKVKLFKDQYDYGYAAISNSGSLEVVPLSSRDFKFYLSYLYYSIKKRSPSSEKLNSALNVLEGKAIHEGERYELHNRVAKVGDAIFYDLGWDSWQIVKITGEGWEIVEHDRPIFRRFQNTKAQVEPEKVEAKEFKRLLRFLNIGEEDEVLVLSAVASYLIPGIPHPLLHPYGEHGNAKSTFCRVIKAVIDPGNPDLLSLSDDRREFIQQLYHHYVVVFDNVSSLTPWQSDELCKAVTGGGFSKRRLYTDDDDIIYHFQRCILINGINIVTTQPDLYDRAVLLELLPIAENERKTEEEFWAEFRSELPRIVGGLFSTISEAMKIADTVKAELKAKTRMADFCIWGEAIARVLGYEPFEFYEAYMNKIQSYDREIVENEILGEVLLAFIEEEREWKGTASELHSALKEFAENRGIELKGKGFPGAPNTLKRKLNRIKPNLRKIGVEITERREGEGKNRRKVITLKLRSDEGRGEGEEEKNKDQVKEAEKISTKSSKSTISGTEEAKSTKLEKESTTTIDDEIDDKSSSEGVKEEQRDLRKNPDSGYPDLEKEGEVDFAEKMVDLESLDKKMVDSDGLVDISHTSFNTYSEPCLEETEDTEEKSDIEHENKNEEKEKAEIVKEEGTVFFKCSRCGTRFLSEADGQAHLEAARKHPEVCQLKKEAKEYDLADFEV